jgi:hypothetical protein
MSKKTKPAKPDAFPAPPVIGRKWHAGNEKVSSYGGRVWTVRDLRTAVENEPVFDLPLSLIPLSDHDFKCADLVEFAEHMLHVQQADLSDPVIMDNRGRLIDGRHRVVKALLEGVRSLPAKRVPDGVLPSSFEQ